MASTRGGSLPFPSAAGLTLPNRRPPRSALALALLSKPRPSATSRRFSALPHTPLPSRKWTTLSAAPESLVVEPEPEPEPEPVEAQIAAFEAGEPPKGEDVFAVVMIGSRQYIVFPGRYITTQRLKGADANDKIILSKVLLVGTRTKTYIGEPVVTNAAVHAVVEEQGLNRKVIVYKYKRKKNYRRNIGHRQPNTRIRITGISGYQDFPAETLESHSA